MATALVLGVDVGTYETKGVVVDGSGRVIATAVRGHRMSVPKPGWAEHDPEEVWWDGFTSVTRRLLNHENVRADAVTSVGVSGIGPCVLPIDATGRPLRPAILYGVDTRASAEVILLEDSFGTEEILRVAGNRLSTQSAGPKIAWLAKHEPNILRQASRIVTSQGFLVGRLTGEWVIDHGTAGYYHPLYHLAEGRWHEPWCDEFVTPGVLPELRWAGEIAGTVTPQAAEETGLLPGTPVIVGTADAPAEALSAGVAEPGLMMIMYGSTIFTIEMLDEALPSPVLYSAPYVFPGTYVLAGSTFTAGTLTRWFRDLVTIDNDTPPSFESLTNEAAESPPGARGLVALAQFSGRRDDPDARGVIAGLDLTHTRGDVFRAILEGIARDVRAILDLYDDHGATPWELRAVGGGTRNRVWVQAVSDCIDREQVVMASTGASFGDAALAALAVGLVEPEDIAGWARIKRRVQPNRALTDLYKRQFAIADRLYRASAGMGCSEALR